MIPSDLERRIIEAKQKVSFCRELYLAHNKLKVHIYSPIRWRTHFGFSFLKEHLHLNLLASMRIWNFASIHYLFLWVVGSAF